MTWSHAGTDVGNSNGPPTHANVTNGNLLILEVINFSNSTVWASSISGGGANWVQAGVKFSGTTNAMSAAVFLGTVTATGAQTPSITWSGTAPATFGTVVNEFHSTAGAWTFDKQGNLDSAGTSNWVSLAPGVGAGELYFGYAANAGSANQGSTSGYIYNQNADTVSNGSAYNVSCPAGATFPVWVDAGQAFGIMVLVSEVAPLTPAPPPLQPPRLPPGWFPGADRVTTEPGGVPFLPQPAPADATPAVIIPPFPEAAAAPPPPLPPGWFPGADKVTTEPGGVPFWAQPGPADPSQAVFPPPAPDPAGIPAWLPLPPTWFPGSQAVSVDPGGIPFYPNPIPLLPALPPPPPPYLTSVAGVGAAKYFTDQYGQPYLLRWDTAWALLCNAGESAGTSYQSDIDNYCTARAAEGFNGFLTTPTGALPAGTNADGTTWDGIAPFTSPGVLNNTFWTRVDYLLNSAAAHGMTVVLNAMFTYALNASGGCIFGWTNGQYTSYGTALGARYATTRNVVWELGDDYGWPGMGGQIFDTQFTAFVTGLRAGGANQLVSTESQSEGSSRYADDGSASYTWAIANTQFNWCYGYNTSYNSVENAYGEAAAHSVPSLVNCRMDGWYDNEGRALTENIELYGRKSIWWSLSSGSRGYMYGMQVVKAWPANVIANGYVSTTPGSQYMQPLAMKTMFDTFASFAGWHLLVPDTASALVTAGRGTRSAEFAAGADASILYQGGNTYVTASRVVDGTLAVIYMPAANTQTITVNGTLMAAGYTATWVDPASGAQTAAGITSTYTRAAANSAGDNDWLLVLQGQAAAPTPPGAGLPAYQPVPPGWFPGADTVTDLPGGIPFYVVPQPTDQNAPAPSGVTTVATAALAGAGTVTAVVTEAPIATVAGAGAVAAAVTEAVTATAAGAGAVTALVTEAPIASLAGAGAVANTPATQAVTASLAGGGSITDVVTQAVIASLAGAGVVNASVAGGASTATITAAGSVVAVATQAATATAAGAGALTATVTQVGAASLTAAGSVNASGQITGTANLTGAGAVTAKAAQAVTAAPAGAGAVSALAAQAATATLAGVGSVTAIGGTQVAFTVGTLTPSDAPAGVLTARDVPGGSGGVLTASDTRTGGPGG